ncbi:LAGLIDADG family homing endonuclease [Streptomyces flavidovirens]|uniref:LAGLIDADG family homing endonuclease n=1 Tax=Streptomyces flavidovirens TaxID=67298 RepID=UPI00343941D5
MRDIAILREFQQLTPYNSSITERVRSTNFSESHHSATWTLCSLEARTVINQLGLPYGKKSKKITPPRVPFSRRDYLRGVIDADGSVGHQRDGSPFISLTTASTAVSVYLCRYARQITGSHRAPKRNARDEIYNIMYTREPAIELAQDLYYPGCLSLARKRAQAESFHAWSRPADMRARPQRRSWTPAEDRALLELGNSTDAAAALGRTKQSCSLRLWRLRTGQVPPPMPQDS